MRASTASPTSQASDQLAPLKVLGAGAVLSGAVASFGLYRTWHTRWGATDAELARVMPGDDVIERPTFNATRAVTIDALPEEIWPWIVQIGFGRAGWYSHDWLDNLGRPSADRIIPELQHIEVGDLVPMGPGPGQGQWVTGFEPNHWVLWSDRRTRPGFGASSPPSRGAPGWSRESECAIAGHNR